MSVAPKCALRVARCKGRTLSPRQPENVVTEYVLTEHRALFGRAWGKTRDPFRSPLCFVSGAQPRKPITSCDFVNHQSRLGFVYRPA
jgi:hypothetical protein